MKVVIKKKIKDDLKLMSHKFGIKESEVVDRALVFYLESLRNILDLEREFQGWDSLTDEAWGNASKRLPSGL
jgi:hypothetical protein